MKFENYHVMHSPRGAGASIAYGAAGDPAGFMCGEGFLPERNLYVGVRRGKSLVCLPFFARGEAEDAESAFAVGARITREAKTYVAEGARHALGAAGDTWATEEMTFTTYTPFSGLADPERASEEEMRLSLLPALAAKLTVRNPGDDWLYGFFGSSGMEGVYPIGRAAPQMAGAGCAHGFGFAAMAGEGVRELADFSPNALMSRREPCFYQNCAMGCLEFAVPPRSERTLRLALGWYRGGIATRGAHALPYAYTKYFSSIEDVLDFALSRFDELEAEAKRLDAWLAARPISEERKFFIAYSVHSYWASTMLFADAGGAMRYVVNEGSYMMMNTFDLSVDHLFFECATQPWTVKNQLEGFAREYSYTDTLHAPGGKGGLPGGRSFTHDQGSYASFTAPGFSSYEMRSKAGCLSYMTQEQLCNWILCAGVYGARDANFAVENAGLLRELLISMQNRDDPDPEKRDGIMDYDSDRCGSEWEITTYDSLDESLGQARRSLYLAVKCASAYLALEYLLKSAGDAESSAEAHSMALLSARAIASAFDENLGFVPALLEAGNAAAIIPAVEGLCYPYFFAPEALRADGEFGPLIEVMKRHLDGVLKEGVCLFPDGGWRLSAGSVNTWMSKIFLNEFVAEAILGRDPALEGCADRAHAEWWQTRCGRCPCVDQVCWGQDYGRGFHYPRAVTSILFALEGWREL